MPPELKIRVFRLLMAVSSHQISLHPRGVKAYAQDMITKEVMTCRFEQVDWKLSDEVEVQEAASITSLEVLDVVGDTVLRTVLWMKGCALDNSEVYDSVLVFLRIGDRILATPAVRPHACCCDDAAMMRHRGDSHGEYCTSNRWVFWIPARNKVDGQPFWIYCQGPETKGNLEASALTDDQLDRRLGRGEWQISFNKVGDVYGVLPVSREASRHLKDLVSELHPSS